MTGVGGIRRMGRRNMGVIEWEVNVKNTPKMPS